MIASVTGTVQRITGTSCVVAVSGVGLEIAAPTRFIRSIKVGQSVVLNTSLIVREDSMTLFGFETLEELQTFDVLLGVSGIGPRMALAILSAMTVDEIAGAVVNQDDRGFTAVSGIGPKTAKLIVVSLSGKLAPSNAESSTTTPNVNEDMIDDVVAALVGLGIDERSSRSLVRDASSQLQTLSRDGLLKKALSLSAERRAGR